MRESFARIDDALIERVAQPAIDWLGERTPLGRFGTARLFLDCSGLAWILSQASAAAQAAGVNPELLCVRVGLMIVGLASLSVLRTVFERSDDSRRNGSANPLRASMHLHRAACLIWLICLLVKVAAAPGLEAMALLAVGLFATAGVYAGACEPPEKLHESKSARLTDLLPSLRRLAGATLRTPPDPRL